MTRVHVFVRNKSRGCLGCHSIRLCPKTSRKLLEQSESSIPSRFGVIRSYSSPVRRFGHPIAKNMKIPLRIFELTIINFVITLRLAFEGLENSERSEQGYENTSSRIVTGARGFDSICRRVTIPPTTLRY